MYGFFAHFVRLSTLALRADPLFPSWAGMTVTDPSIYVRMSFPQNWESACGTESNNMSEESGKPCIKINVCVPAYFGEVRW